MRKQSKMRNRPKSQESKGLRIIPQNGDLWFVAGDVCGLLGLIERRALAVLPVEVRRAAEVDANAPGQMYQIVDVSGFYALIRTNRTLKGVGLAEWLKTVVIPELGKQTPLNPASVQAFEYQFDEMIAFFEGLTRQKKNVLTKNYQFYNAAEV